MKVVGECEKARLYLESRAQFISEKEYNERKRDGGPFITISRQTGIAEEIIYQKLLQYLQKDNQGKEWRFFDRELIHKIISEHHLPDYFKKIITEDKYSLVKSFSYELLGTGYDMWSLFNKIRLTIIHLTEPGYVIVVGRGANLITSRMQGGLHIRLVASLQNRIKYIAECKNISRREAAKFIKEDEIRRKGYLHTYFSRELDDPLIYDMVINTDYMGLDGTAYVISKAAKEKAVLMGEDKTHLNMV